MASVNIFAVQWVTCTGRSSYVLACFFIFLFLSFEVAKRLYACACSDCCQTDTGAGAGPAGSAAAGSMLEAKLMNLIKGLLQKFWLSNNFSVKFRRHWDSSKVNTQKWRRTWPSLDVRAEIILHHFLDNSEYIVIPVIMLPLRNLHKTCML